MAEIVLDAEGYFFVGMHRFRFEPPDVFHMCIESEVTPEHFEQFYETVVRLSPDRPVYFLRDERGRGQLNAKAREHSIKIVDPQRLAAVVSYGAAFRRRVLISMMVRAIRAVKRSAPEVVFFDSEADAREWIKTHRMRTQ